MRAPYAASLAPITINAMNVETVLKMFDLLPFHRSSADTACSGGSLLTLAELGEVVLASLFVLVAVV